MVIGVTVTAQDNHQPGSALRFASITCHEPGNLLGGGDARPPRAGADREAAHGVVRKPSQACILNATLLMTCRGAPLSV
jgi:hypothetical protein